MQTVNDETFRLIMGVANIVPINCIDQHGELGRRKARSKLKKSWVALPRTRFPNGLRESFIPVSSHDPDRSVFDVLP